jgi:hypothetical protein
MMDFVKRWDPVVPFQQRGGVADKLKGMGVHLPYRVEHWVIVGVEKVLFELRVTGDMNLPNAMMRNVIEVIVGIESTTSLRNSHSVISEAWYSA